jgi:dethiobiotin synthetase
MNAKGFFITGTDTEVGKTLIAGALILKLQELGQKTIGFKPVAAGLKEIDGKLLNDDVETLLKISRRVNPELNEQDICPYILHEPAAPHLVAKKLGVFLDPKLMLEGYKRIISKADFVVVEGAGGFLVPVNEHYTLGDFAKELHLPVILVVNIKLGCINHALLSIETIQTKGLSVFGWVANLSQKATEYSDENIESLERILQLNYGVSLIGKIPFLEDLSSEGLYSEECLNLVKQHLHLSIKG